MAGKRNLKCWIRKGMFDDEYLVIIDALDQYRKKIKMCMFVGKEELEVKSFPEGDEEVVGLLAVSLQARPFGHPFVYRHETSSAHSAGS